MSIKRLAQKSQTLRLMELLTLSILKWGQILKCTSKLKCTLIVKCASILTLKLK